MQSGDGQNGHAEDEDAHSSDACGGCHHTSQTHSHAGAAEHAHSHGQGQETTAATRFGIRSFVYSRRLPFHPQRCSPPGRGFFNFISFFFNLQGICSTRDALDNTPNSSPLLVLPDTGSRPWCCAGCLWRRTRPSAMRRKHRAHRL